MEVTAFYINEFVTSSFLRQEYFLLMRLVVYVDLAQLILIIWIPNILRSQRWAKRKLFAIRTVFLGSAVAYYYCIR